MKKAPRLRGLAVVLVLVLAFAASAGGQTVHVVAGDGGGDFVQAMDAVSATADGDVILVHHGCVWFADLVVAGANGAAQTAFETGLRGAHIEFSDCVVVVDSEFRGGFDQH